MNDPKPPCYDTAEQNSAARFETAAHGTFALPYSTLLCTHLTPATAGGVAETLSLIYSTHTVTIAGTQLASLLLAFQKSRVEAVRISGSQTNTAPTLPAVRQITVAEGFPQTKS